MLHQKAKFLGSHSAGVSLASAARALSEAGQCRLDLCPYEESEAILRISDAAITDAETRKACLVKHRPTFDCVKKFIIASRPVLLVMQICPEFYSTQNGVIETPDPVDVLPGLHGVLATGIVKCGAEETLEFRNSWGDLWGDNGYGYVKPSYIDTYCTDALVLCR